MNLKVGYQTMTIRPLTSQEGAVGNCSGFCHASEGVIAISTNITPPEQAAVLLHELIHAIHHFYALDREGLNEEGICNALEGPLLSLFVDNPGLGKLLQDAAKGRSFLSKS